jgi:hypothetical protein
LAMLSWLISALLSARSKRRTEALWSLGVLALSGLTMIAGGLDGVLHAIVQVLTVGVAVRNGWAFRGACRWLTVAGILAWMASAVIAMRHFG